MRPWYIKLKTDSANMERLLSILNHYRFEILEKENSFYLHAEEIDMFDNAEDAEQAAKILIQKINNIILIFSGIDEKIEFDSLYRKTSSGNLISHIEGTVISANISVSVALWPVNEDGSVNYFTEGDSKESIVSNINTFLDNNMDQDEDIKDIMLYRNQDTWDGLYKALEAINKRVKNNKIVKRGWAKKDEISLFKQTANSKESIGHEARHGYQKDAPPKIPMKFTDAKIIIDRIIKEYMKFRFNDLKT